MGINARERGRYGNAWRAEDQRERKRDPTTHPQPRMESVFVKPDLLQGICNKWVWGAGSAPLAGGGDARFGNPSHSSHGEGMRALASQ